MWTTYFETMQSTNLVCLALRLDARHAVSNAPNPRSEGRATLGSRQNVSPVRCRPTSKH